MYKLLDFFKFTNFLIIEIISLFTEKIALIDFKVFT